MYILEKNILMEGSKYFARYKYNEKIKLLRIICPRVSKYTKKFDENKYVFFD